MRFIAIIALVLTFSAGIVVSSAAQAQDDGGKGILGGLFNNGGSGGGGGGSPIFINRGNPSGTSGNAGASRTGVARTDARRGGEGAINYRVVPNKPQDEMSVGELIQQSTAEQNAKTDQYVERKRREAEDMAAMYREQMRERLASQSNDPSALQSMGAGGTGGVSGEQIRRKMIYEPDNSVTGGKKPIRLFNVR